MSSVWKRRLLGLALAATLVAVYFAPNPQDEAVLPRARNITTVTPPASTSNAGLAASHNQGSRSAENLEVLSIQPRALPDVSKTLFPADQWTPAVKTVAAQADTPPPPPQAPPLPFKVLGRYVEEGRVNVFLQYNDQNLVVQVGDLIAGLYKVESLNGSVLTLLYIPLNQTQSLDVGAVN